MKEFAKQVLAGIDEEVKEMYYDKIAPLLSSENVKEKLNELDILELERIQKFINEEVQVTRTFNMNHVNRLIDKAVEEKKSAGLVSMKEFANQVLEGRDERDDKNLKEMFNNRFVPFFRLGNAQEELNKLDTGELEAIQNFIKTKVMPDVAAETLPYKVINDAIGKAIEKKRGAGLNQSQELDESVYTVANSGLNQSQGLDESKNESANSTLNLGSNRGQNPDDISKINSSQQQNKSASLYTNSPTPTLGEDDELSLFNTHKEPSADELLKKIVNKTIDKSLGGQDTPEKKEFSTAITNALMEIARGENRSGNLFGEKGFELPEEMREDLRKGYKDLNKLCDETNEELAQYDKDKFKNKQWYNDQNKGGRVASTIGAVVAAVAATALFVLAAVFASPLLAVGAIGTGLAAIFSGEATKRYDSKIEAAEQQRIKDEVSADITKEFENQFDKFIDAINAKVEKLKIARGLKKLWKVFVRLMGLQLVQLTPELKKILLRTPHLQLTTKMKKVLLRKY